ncbi:Chromate transporter [Penicillium concentricum]|uniref:Chromate transporter n=1 Tax=Penicillium concentricum TaxID=293559 RepID=A0A9W9RV06_9EURO|nr:Chromate transporter [Penicillium concentricum]KAJ5365539.1 Chromate transporter [Penicillium concentricum]
MANEDMNSTPLATKSSIERQIEVTPAIDVGQFVFANKYPLWHPKGTRGIFGGITIAQSLSAAQKTVKGEFDAHSMHCTFVFAGTAFATIHYHVEIVRDGRTFCTRAVRAIQDNRTIFLATISFARPPPESITNIRHAERNPPAVPIPHDTGLESNSNEETTGLPYINQSVGMLHSSSADPCDKRLHQWIKTRGKISPQGGSRAHLAALAFMSDSYFLAGLPHAHNIWEFVNPPITESYESEEQLEMPSPIHTKILRPHLQGGGSVPDQSHRVGMMVSLDHTIYFHQAKRLKADEWLLTEVKTNWADNGRGVVLQKIWARDGTLLASCTQEGVLRLEDRPSSVQISKVNSRL